MPPVRKTPLLGQFYIKTIILPRQARDKHRESTQKRTVLSQATGANLRDSGRRSSRAISRRSSRCVQCPVSAHPPAASSVRCCVATHPARGARAGLRRCSCSSSAAGGGCSSSLAGSLRRTAAASPRLCYWLADCPFIHAHARASPAAHLLVSVLSAFPVCVVPPPPPLPPPLPLCFIAAVFCRWNFAAHREDRPE
jgi:hypothetical protein